MRLPPHQMPGAGHPNVSIANAIGGVHQHNSAGVQSLPVFPNVRFAPHPFYEQQQSGELMRVKTLMNSTRPFVAKGVYEATFPFHLSSQQANMIFQNRVEWVSILGIFTSHRSGSGLRSTQNVFFSFCKILFPSTYFSSTSKQWLCENTSVRTSTTIVLK